MFILLIAAGAVLL